jgi:GxxExxY protein
LHENEIGTRLIGAAMKVHSVLGPGLLESAYELCLLHELQRCGIGVRRQVAMPIRYEGIEIEGGYRLDLLLQDLVVVELKAVETLLPLHSAQLLSYLKLGNYRLGYLLNFNIIHMRDGIRRLVNGL